MAQCHSHIPETLGGFTRNMEISARHLKFPLLVCRVVSSGDGPVVATFTWEDRRYIQNSHGELDRKGTVHYVLQKLLPREAAAENQVETWICSQKMKV